MLSTPPEARPAGCAIVDAERRTRVVGRCEIALSRCERARGLLGRDRLEEGAGLLIPRCRQVHTFGMRFPIDVVFVDREWTVVRTLTLRTGRISPIVWRARDVVELESGALERNGVREGDRLTAVLIGSAGPAGPTTPGSQGPPGSR